MIVNNSKGEFSSIQLELNGHNNWLKLLSVPNTNEFEKAIDVASKELTDITSRSTRGEHSVQTTLTECKQLEKLFRQNVSKEVSWIDKCKFNHSWVVEGDKGSYHQLHRHLLPYDLTILTNDISCVYYLEVPEHKQEGDGAFYFLFENNGFIEHQEIQPKTGDLVIMPSTMWHGVYPQSKGIRRVVNMEFRYAP